MYRFHDLPEKEPRKLETAVFAVGYFVTELLRAGVKRSKDALRRLGRQASSATQSTEKPTTQENPVSTVHKRVIEHTRIPNVAVIPVSEHQSDIVFGESNEQLD